MRLTVDGGPAKCNYFEGVAFEGFNKENELIYTIFYSHLLSMQVQYYVHTYITTFYPPGPSLSLSLTLSIETIRQGYITMPTCTQRLLAIKTHHSDNLHTLEAFRLSHL